MMDRRPLIEWVPARWRGPLAIAVAVGIGVGLYLVGRLYRDDPVTFTEPVEHFKYGSTGGERLSGFPYWIWQALPALFPEYLPGGKYLEKTPYAPFGFIYEPEKALPIGTSKRNVQGMDRVFLNCAICHTGTWRGTPEDVPKIVVGMPANTVDLQAFERFLFNSVTDERFTPERVLSAIEKIGGRLDQLDENALRKIGVYIMRDRVLLLRNRFQFMEREPACGPGRVDTFNPPKVLMNFPMSKVPEREWVGNCDLPSIWLQGGARKHMWLHWDGNCNSVRERNRSAAFGTGAQPPSLDRPLMKRVEEWIAIAEPPAFPRPRDAAKEAKGKVLYLEYCASCHGQSGRDFTGKYIGQVTPVDDEPPWILPRHFKESSHLLAVLPAQSDPVSKFLWAQFSEEARKLLGEASASVAHKKSVLAHELNRVIAGSSIYDPQRFTGAKLSTETNWLMSQAQPSDEQRWRLNRLLLEDAYRGPETEAEPDEIKHSFKGVGTDRWRLDSYSTELLAGQHQLYAEYGDERFHHFRKTFGYANAPLDGIWLRAPYLHNGSVPTLRDLLNPAKDRPTQFYRGYDVYDFEKVGWRSEPIEPSSSKATNPHLEGRRYFSFETQPRTGKDTGAFAIVEKIEEATRVVALSNALLRNIEVTKIADAAGKVLAWDIPVEHGVVGEKTVILSRLPPELRKGMALDYSTPVERNEGNSNVGHEYGTHLNAEEKDAIVEFMKSF